MALVESSYYEDESLRDQVGQYTPPPPVRLQRGGWVRLVVAAIAAFGSAGALAYALTVTPDNLAAGGQTIIALDKNGLASVQSPSVVDTEFDEKIAARQVALLADLALPPAPQPSMVDLSKPNPALGLTHTTVDETTGMPEMQEVVEAEVYHIPDGEEAVVVAMSTDVVETEGGTLLVPLRAPSPRPKPSTTASSAQGEPSADELQRQKLAKSEAGFQTADVATESTRKEPITLSKSAAHLSGRALLNPAPFAPITQNSANGLLPVVGSGGETSREYYKRPFADHDTRPRISLVVGGLGLSEKATAAAINQLPGEVTLAFAPYGKNLQTWINKARAAGHEVLLELPMEPFDYPANDPGPFTLLTNNDIAQNTKRLEWLLAQFNGYVGVTNYLGAKFTSSPEALLPILRELDQRGLLVLDDGSSNRSQVPALSKKLQVPFAHASRTIDLRASRAAIDDNLLDLEGVAMRKGAAIGMGFAYPVTIDRIVNWAASLEEKGFVLAPVSANVVGPSPSTSFDQHASNY